MKLVQAVLASPKSKIFKVQSDFTTILLGFRSCGAEMIKSHTVMLKDNLTRWYTVTSNGSENTAGGVS